MNKYENHKQQQQQQQQQLDNFLPFPPPNKGRPARTARTIVRALLPVLVCVFTRANPKRFAVREAVHRRRHPA